MLKAALETVITKDGRFKSKKIVKTMLNKNVKFPVINDIYATIDEFVREKYFQQIDEYHYILPRALIEFNTYFRSYYRDFVTDCALCKAIVIRPHTCRHCSAPFHKACADRYTSDQAGEKCISCNNSFELNDSVDSIQSEDANATLSGTGALSRVADWLNETQEPDSDAESNPGSLAEAMDIEHSQAT